VTAPAQPDLRQQIANAIRTAPAGRRATNPMGDHGTGHQYDGACALCRADANALTDAVLALVQPLLDQRDERIASLRAEIRAQGDALIRARIQMLGRGAENARLRAAWHSARSRAGSYSELVDRVCEDRAQALAWLHTAPCGCPIASVHPSHYPSCPTRAAALSATT
jgi:hypothetical protein